MSVIRGVMRQSYVIYVSLERRVILYFCFIVQGGQFDAKSFLLYYYYGGMIYLALKNYKRALFFFEIVSNVKTG